MKVTIKAKMVIELETFDSIEHLKTALSYFLENEDNASSDEGDTVATLLDSIQ